MNAPNVPLSNLRVKQLILTLIQTTPRGSAALGSGIQEILDFHYPSRREAVAGAPAKAAGQKETVNVAPLEMKVLRTVGNATSPLTTHEIETLLAGQGHTGYWRRVKSLVLKGLIAKAGTRSSSTVGAVRKRTLFKVTEKGRAYLAAHGA